METKPTATQESLQTFSRDSGGLITFFDKTAQLVTTPDLARFSKSKESSNHTTLLIHRTMTQIVILICLMMAAEIQAQCKRPSVGENRVLTSETDKPNFEEGSTATFKCAAGYSPVEGTYSTSISCTGNRWTDLQLQCKRKSCGTLTELSNGKYIFEDIFFGSNVTAICNPGYLLVGDKIRYCKADGWDGREPICDVVICSAPPEIINGKHDAEKEEYEYGEAVTYSCLKGYFPREPTVVTCSSNRTFQPSPPQCVSVTCPDPDVKNGQRIDGKAPPYVPRNFVQYKCYKDYIMVGKDYLTCTESGWDSSPPNCTSQCPQPNFGKHRVLTVESDKPPFLDGSTATVKCSPGYEPVDETVSKSVPCIDKQWKDPQLTCKKKSCGRLKEFHNGYYVYEGMEFGSIARAECNSSYKLVEESTRTCQDNGWDGRDPVCEVVTCLGSLQIHHGHLDEPKKNEYKYGEVVTYSCIDDYIPNENQKIVCSADGTFHPSPICSRPNPFPLWLIIVIVLGLFIALIGIYCLYKHRCSFGTHSCAKVFTRNRDVEKDVSMCARTQMI